MILGLEFRLHSVDPCSYKLWIITFVNLEDLLILSSWQATAAAVQAAEGGGASEAKLYKVLLRRTVRVRLRFRIEAFRVWGSVLENLGSGFRSWFRSLGQIKNLPLFRVQHLEVTSIATCAQQSLFGLIGEHLFGRFCLGKSRVPVLL